MSWLNQATLIFLIIVVRAEEMVANVGMGEEIFESNDWWWMRWWLGITFPTVWFVLVLHVDFGLLLHGSDLGQLFSSPSCSSRSISQLTTSTCTCISGVGATWLIWIVFCVHFFTINSNATWDCQFVLHWLKTWAAWPTTSTYTYYV